MKLNDLQKGQLFKMLASKSLLEVGVEFGFDKWYKNKAAIRNAVNKVYCQVKANLNRFDISPEVAQLVEEGKKNRTSVKPISNEVSYAEENKPLQEMSLQELVGSSRKKAWVVLNQRLDWLLRNGAALKKEKIAPLAIVAATVFDKARLLDGESTENLAVNAEIKKDANTDELLGMLLNRREETFFKNQPQEKK